MAEKMVAESVGPPNCPTGTSWQILGNQGKRQVYKRGKWKMKIGEDPFTRAQILLLRMNQVTPSIKNQSEVQRRLLLKILENVRSRVATDAFLCGVACLLRF